MKRFVILILLVGLMFSLSSSLALAKSEDKSVKRVTQFSEITNFDQLYERAKKGITEKVEGVQEKSVKTKIKNDLSGKQIDVKVYRTTQRIKEIEFTDGSIETVYATTTFSDITESDIGIMSSGNGNRYTENKSDTVVRPYSTIYWSWHDNTGPVVVKLTRVTGGWTRLDSTWALTNGKVRYGNSGPSENSGIPINQSDTWTAPPATYTFDFSTPLSWVYVVPDEYSAIGATSEIKVSRGSTSYTLSLENSY